MEFSTNWQVVILDVWILVCLIVISFFLAGDLKRKSMLLLAAGFILMAAGVFITFIGDILLALGFTAKDHPILSREFRPLPLRYCFGTGLTCIAAVLRYGQFNGHK